MFKDYYKILEVESSATALEIKSAYRTLSKRWHPDKNPNVDVTIKMQDINEAYAILKDEEKRRRYDVEYLKFNEQFKSHISEDEKTARGERTYYYDYNIYDETLKRDINDAREYAKKLVDEFIKSFRAASKRAIKGAWKEMKPYLVGFLVLLSITAIIFLFVIGNDGFEYQKDYLNEYYLLNEYIENKQENDHNVIKEDAYIAPESWKKYSISDNAFCISVPNTVELRKDDDKYTTFMKNKGYVCNKNVVIFQQKGLSTLPSNVDAHYCRIMLLHIKAESGDCLKSNETEPLDDVMKSQLREMVEAELGGQFVLLEEPKYRWLDVNGVKVLETKYRRSGNNGDATACTMYILSNYDEVVKIIVAYRESEEDIWMPDLGNVIRTFVWQ